MRSLRPILIALNAALAAGAAQGKTYDAVAQFSPAANTETQTWTYRYSQSGTRDGHYTLLPHVDEDDADWLTDRGKAVPVFTWDTDGPSYPFIGANTTNKNLHRNYCCGDVVLPARSMFEDPGTQIGVLSFLSPRKGVATVTYSFTDIDCHGGNGIEWYVDKNSGLKKDLDSGFLQSTACDFSQYATTGLKTLHVRVKRGDRINFIIDNAGDYTFDSSAFTADVSFGN